MDNDDDVDCQQGSRGESVVEEQRRNGSELYSSVASGSAGVADDRSNRGNFDNLRRNYLPKRPCSVYFKQARDPTNVQSFLAELKNHGIPVSAVKCSQRLDKESFMVTFDKPEYCEAFSSRSPFVHHAVNPVYNVFVYDAPYELHDDALGLRMQAFGDVKSAKRLKYAGYDLETGVRLVRMSFDRFHPPSFLRFGLSLVRLRYNGQVPTCRRCNRVGHQAKECPNTVCFNCDELGHQAGSCPHAMRCSICKSENHVAVDCSFWNRTASVDAPSDDRPGVSLASQATEPQSASQDSSSSSPSSSDSSDSSSSSAASPLQVSSPILLPGSLSDQADTSHPPGFSPSQDPLSTFNLDPSLPSITDSDKILAQMSSQVEDNDDHEMEQSSSKRRASSPNREFDNDVSKRKC